MYRAARFSEAADGFVIPMVLMKTSAMSCSRFMAVFPTV